MFHLLDLFHKKHEEATGENNKAAGKEEEEYEDEYYSGVLTADGKRLKKIPGGYTLHGTGGDYWEDDIVSS